MMHSDKRPLPAMMVPAIPSYPPQGSVYCSSLSLKSRYWPSSAFTGWWQLSNHWVKCRPSHNSHPLLNMFLTQDGEFKISLILVCSFPSSSLILLSIDSLSLSSFSPLTLSLSHSLPLGIVLQWNKPKTLEEVSLVPL